MKRALLSIRHLTHPVEPVLYAFHSEVPRFQNGSWGSLGPQSFPRSWPGCTRRGLACGLPTSAWLLLLTIPVPSSPRCKAVQGSSLGPRCVERHFHGSSLPFPRRPCLAPWAPAMEAFAGGPGGGLEKYLPPALEFLHAQVDGTKAIFKVNITVPLAQECVSFPSGIFLQA